MSYYIVGSLWAVIGIYSIQSYWRKTLDIALDQIILLLFFGITIGPIIGFFELINNIICGIWPRCFGRVVLKKKSK